VRAWAPVLAAALLAAGCGGSKSREPLTGSSDGTIGAILSRPGPDVALIPGTSDYAPGTVRLSFLVIRPNGKPVYTQRAKVLVARSSDSAPVASGLARLEPVGVKRNSTAEGEVTNLYVAHLSLPRAGRYLVAAEPAGGAPIQAEGQLDVKPHSVSPAVGSKALASRTPTLASAHGNLRLLTTRVPPDRDLLRFSVAGSLAARTSFVVVFATPRFCTSRTCGPVVDVVQSVARRFRGSSVRFIHVEIYRDNNPIKGYNRFMREWHLPTEPWTFLVGSDGRIKAKFEGSVSENELAAAVRSRLVR
jgi:hypothetical protein